MEESQLNILWKNIQRLRVSKEMTQDEFSRKVDIPYTTLTKIEIWVIKSPSVFMVAKIARALDVSVEELISPPKEEKRSSSLK